MNSRVCVLFARRDSVYKRDSRCEVFDLERDAINSWIYDHPVIAHPPCRAFGRLRHLAKPRPGELELADYSVEQVRTKGGVLEHPAYSQLWKRAGLPRPGCRDQFGGFTLAFPQYWFGHQADKASWFYFCHIKAMDLPPMPLVLGRAPNVVERLGRAAREHTPQALATWLVDSALSAHPRHNFSNFQGDCARAVLNPCSVQASVMRPAILRETQAGQIS